MGRSGITPSEQAKVRKCPLLVTASSSRYLPPWASNLTRWGATDDVTLLAEDIDTLRTD
jgi:hypothetical protein